MGSTRKFSKHLAGAGAQAVPLIGTLACGCDVAGRMPEIAKPVAKWWCCGAFQKRKAAK